jgi:collagenase-like PrtC family protease
LNLSLHKIDLGGVAMVNDFVAALGAPAIIAAAPAVVMVCDLATRESS